MKADRERTRKLVLRLSLVALVLAWFLVPLLFISTGQVRGEDYNFGSEQVNEGYSIDPSNRNAEDAAYNQLIEEDQYTDTNFSGSSESMTYGTAGGDSFPTSLNTDDESYRTYTEENTGESPPSPYTVYIFPTGDSSVGWDEVFPVSPTTHYDKVDETTVDSDGDTTYITTGTTDDEDRFNMADIGDPGTGYNIDVTVFAVHKKDANQLSNFKAGVRISSTNYLPIDLNPVNGVWTNTSATTWTVNPYTSGEWTYAEVDAILCVIYAGDASPDIYCSQIGLKIDVTFSGGSTNYELDGTITFSSVTSTAQTTGYMVYCQAYRTDASEDFGIFAWDYVAEEWSTIKDTIDQASDTDFNFALTTDERDGTGNEVKIRILGLTETSDATQNVVYFDVLKVSRIEVGYDLDIEMTASSTNEYGEQRLRVKAYTSTETFYVDIYNVSSAGWDTAVITITELSNTWHTFDLNESAHRSGTQQVEIRFRDGTDHTSDTTQDTCYLDVAWITWLHSDPTITLYHDNGPVNLGSSAQFWLNYTDTDNEAPTYVRVVIDSTPYDMSKNETDTTYWDGVNYSFSKSDLTGGAHPYYFAVKDANSGEVTTGEDSITINRAPTLTLDGVTPPTGNNGETFYFYVNYTDLENNEPDYIEVVIGATPYTMTKNDSEDSTYDDGVNYSYSKAMSGGSYQYYFRTADYLSSEVSTTPKNLDVNNIPTLGDYSRWPGDPVYPNTQIYFNVTFYDIDGDLPTDIKWREDGGTTQNLSMTQTDAEDENTVDGKDYWIQLTLGHGGHNYDYYASDGMGSVSGGSNSITIQNRDPIIENTPGTTSTYRSTYWEWDVDATDPDTDSITFDEWNNCTFELTINPSSGLLSGTTDTNLGWYEVWVYANDSYGGSDSYNFQLYVINRAPIITSSGNTTQQYMTFMCYEVVAEDADGDSLSYALWSEAPFLSIENHWVNGTASTEGTFLCHVWANDSYGGSDMEEWYLEVGNQAPYFTSTPTYTVQNASAYVYDADAVDPEEQELTYSMLTNASFLDPINPSTGYISGTADKVGSYWINVSVSDGEKGAYQNFTFQVQNSAPVITTTSPPTTGEIGIPYYFDADATDSNGDTLSWDLTQKFSWMFVDSETGEVQGTPTASGQLEIKLRVFDGYAYDWLNWTLTIPSDEEEEPPPTPPSPVPGAEDTLQVRFRYYLENFTVTAIDLTDGEVAKRQWDFGDGYGSQAKSIEHTYAFPGTYTLRLTVTDEDGNSYNASVELTVGWAVPIQKGEVGWLVTIEGKTYEIPAYTFIGLGLLSFISIRFFKKVPVLTPTRRKALGIILIVVGIAWFAL